MFNLICVHMLNFVTFYESLKRDYPLDYANWYFDNWLLFWMSCGDEMQCMDAFRKIL